CRKVPERGVVVAQGAPAEAPPVGGAGGSGFEELQLVEMPERLPEARLVLALRHRLQVRGDADRGPGIRAAPELDGRGGILEGGWEVPEAAADPGPLEEQVRVIRSRLFEQEAEPIEGTGGGLRAI